MTTLPHSVSSGEDAPPSLTLLVASLPRPSASPSIRKYGRYWAVYDATDVLICLCVYYKGAREVVRRLQEKA